MVSFIITNHGEVNQMSHTSSKCENTLFIDVVLGKYWWKEPKMYITLFDSCLVFLFYPIS